MRVVQKTFSLVFAIVALSSVSATSVATAQGNILERRVIGTSIQGRPLEAIRMGDPKGVTVAVIGVIHGNEEAGLLITDELVNMQIPKGSEPMGYSFNES